jgi:hypothetical protein
LNRPPLAVHAVPNGEKAVEALIALRLADQLANGRQTNVRRTGILQVKEFSTGKGIKPPTEARFLQVKEKRQPSELILT